MLKNNQNYNIICSKDDLMYHYDYFKSELTPFTSYLTEQGYINSAWFYNNSKINMGNLTFYHENINKNTYIYIWKYKGFYTLNSIYLLLKRKKYRVKFIDILYEILYKG